MRPGTDTDDTYQRLSARYAAGNLPWDQPEPPPEVMALAEALQPGRALDVGCGYGRSAIYLAGRGWEVDAVDFVGQAVREARRRARAAGVGHRVHVCRGAAPALGFLLGGYDLVLDVGCLHSAGPRDLGPYRAELARLLRPGGLFALFCRLRAPDAPDEPETRPRGLVEADLLTTFADGFRLDRAEHGSSTSGAWPDWPSAWFWWVRTA